jgi:hypothetical protein
MGYLLLNKEIISSFTLFLLFHTRWFLLSVSDILLTHNLSFNLNSSIFRCVISFTENMNSYIPMLCG